VGKRWHARGQTPGVLFGLGAEGRGFAPPDEDTFAVGTKSSCREGRWPCWRGVESSVREVEEWLYPVDTTREFDEPVLLELDAEGSHSAYFAVAAARPS
jgi:hypothetical protein